GREVFEPRDARVPRDTLSGRKPPAVVAIDQRGLAPAPRASRDLGRQMGTDRDEAIAIAALQHEAIVVRDRVQLARARLDEAVDGNRLEAVVAIERHDPAPWESHDAARVRAEPQVAGRVFDARRQPGPLDPDLRAADLGERVAVVAHEISGGADPDRAI